MYIYGPLAQPGTWSLSPYPIFFGFNLRGHYASNRLIFHCHRLVITQPLWLHFSYHAPTSPSQNHHDTMPQSKFFFTSRYQCQSLKYLIVCDLTLLFGVYFSRQVCWQSTRQQTQRLRLPRKHCFLEPPRRTICWNLTGVIFSPHYRVFNCVCFRTADDGWAAPHISEYQPLAMNPSSSCLHYGLEVQFLVAII